MKGQKLIVIPLVMWPVVVMAQSAPDLGIEARLSAPETTIPPGEPVVVEFSLRNLTDRPVVLTVPGIKTDSARKMSGLDLSHVFSGPAFRSLSVASSFDRVWREPEGYKPPQSAPQLIIAPYGVVGTAVAIDPYYPALRTTGFYRLVWEPFGALVRSNVLTLDVSPFKQAVITTDAGTMTMLFDYRRAPNHVANFIELANSGFYNQKTFHRIEPGYFMQGGCPNGDGTGIRLDGKKLKAEFNDHPFDRGTVSMARLENDPDSASCQFIIVNTRLPDWDGRYTAFGQLVGDESYATLEKLMQTPVDGDGRPVRAVYIRSVRIEDAPAGRYDEGDVGGRVTVQPRVTQPPGPGVHPPHPSDHRPVAGRRTVDRGADRHTRQRSPSPPGSMQPMTPVSPPASPHAEPQRQHTQPDVHRHRNPPDSDPTGTMRPMDPVP